MAIIILGAGLIGMIEAYRQYQEQLQNNSQEEIIIIEKNSQPCLEISYGNGGQLSFSHCEPISTLYNLKKTLIHGLISLGKNYTTKLEKSVIFDRQFKLFLKEYLKNLTVRKGFSKLLKKLEESKRIASNMLDDIGYDNVNYNNNGLIYYFTKKSSLERYRKIFNANGMIESGLIKPLTEYELYEQDEAFAVSRKKFAGGFYAKEDGSLSSYMLCKKLYKYLKARGVVFKFNEKFKDFKTKENKQNNVITQVVTSKDSYGCKKVISCLGVDIISKQNIFKEKIPIYPVRGYSVKVDTSYSNYRPQHALIDSEKRIVYSSNEFIDKNGNQMGELKVAGFSDILTLKTSQDKNKIEELTKKRTDDIIKRLHEAFPALKTSKIYDRWSGVRPMASNSMPIIKKSDYYNNLTIKTGHGTLGLTLGFL